VPQPLIENSTSSFRDVIPEINVWRAANLMLKHYGNEAEAESARRADELWEVGDAAGVAVWRRVMGAVRHLVNMTPPGHLARNTIIESTFDVGRRFSCTMRVDCGQLEPGAVIRPVPGDGARVCPSASTKRSCGLARGPQCGLSARRTDNRRAPRGR
jgi:hypothetical protein